MQLMIHPLKRASRTFTASRHITSYAFLPSRSFASTPLCSLRPQKASRHISSIRHTSTSASPKTQIRSLSYLVLLLAGAATSYGLYIVYQSWATWPAPLRSILRQALRNQRQGRLPEAEQLFKEALQVSKQPELQPSLDIFKTSGIAISLGGVIEAQKRPQDALQVYDQAFKNVSKAMDTAKRDQALMMRGVALAQKVGQLASDLPGAEYQKLAEKRMSWAVTKLLKTVAQHQDQQGDRSNGLDLPEFVTRTDLGASMEDLGMFYLARGNKE